MVFRNLIMARFWFFLTASLFCYFGFYERENNENSDLNSKLFGQAVISVFFKDTVQHAPLINGELNLPGPEKVDRLNAPSSSERS
jgi:hypothetical protein